MNKFVIAIDGPSGVGKSTLGKALARHFHFLFIDSGAVYRAIALQALQQHTPLDHREAVAAIACRAQVKLEGDPDALRVYLDGQEVTQAIRASEVTRAASVIATIPQVREAVVEKLRRMADASGVVMDGRDIGTTVFPNAPVKLFLEAAPEVRAQRRWLEERNKGREVSYEQVKAELVERDARDRDRAATPLVKADDAILIDTSTLDLEKLIARVLEIVESRG
ncbi:MAG: (d)CMP kinase [Acidobacteria bacterium]|nr:(d)CMP kinase [Acidobacteriota bacterium]